MSNPISVLKRSDQPLSPDQRFRSELASHLTQDFDTPNPTTEQVVDAPRRSRRINPVWAAVPAALLVIVVVGLPGLLNSRTPPTTVPTIEEPPGPLTVTSGSGTWSSTAHEFRPLALGNSAVGDRWLFYWGGRGVGQGSEGLLVDLVSGESQPIPDAPIRARTGAAILWTGSEFIVFGGQNFSSESFVDGAAFDPTTGQWRAITSAPTTPTKSPAAIWLGDRVLVWMSENPSGITESPEPSYGQVAVYEPASDTWTTLEPPPFQSVDAAWVAGPDGPILLGGPAMRDIGVTTQPSTIRTATLDMETLTWQRGPDGPTAETGRGFIDPGGHLTLLLDDGRILSLHGSDWIERTQLPGPHCWWDPGTAQGGGRTYVRFCDSFEATADHLADTNFDRPQFQHIIVFGADASGRLVVLTGEEDRPGSSNEVRLSIYDPQPQLPEGNEGGLPISPISVENGATTFRVALTTGEILTVTLPEALGGQIDRFRPGGTVGWPERVETDPVTGNETVHCCGRGMEIRVGTIDDRHPATTPDGTYLDALGQPVQYYRNSTGSSEMVFQFGSWIVIVPDWQPNGFTSIERSRFAALLGGYETSDGFLVLSPLEPMDFEVSHSSPEASFESVESAAHVWFWLPRPGRCDGESVGDLRLSEGTPVTSLCDPATGNTLMFSMGEDRSLSREELEQISFEVSRPPGEPPSSQPFEPRTGHVAVWTGEEVLVYGGWGAPLPSPPLTTGIAIDPSTGAWREMAPSPINFDGYSPTRAVWTGTEMLVVGQTMQSGEDPTTIVAHYSPDDDQWTVGPSVPKPSLGAVVWTGSELILFGGDYNNMDGAAWAYDPDVSSWRQLPDAGVPIVEAAEGVWTGTEAVFVGGSVLGGNGIAVAYNPATETWRDFSGPTSEVTGHDLIWTGSQIVRYSGTVGNAHPNTVSILDPVTGIWSTSSPIPVATRERLASAWTGEHLILWGGYQTYRHSPDNDGDYTFGDGVMYDPVTDTWTLLPTSPLADRCSHSGTWTGQLFVVFGGLFDCERETVTGTAGTFNPTTGEWTLLIGD